MLNLNPERERVTFPKAAFTRNSPVTTRTSRDVALDRFATSTSEESTYCLHWEKSLGESFAMLSIARPTQHHHSGLARETSKLLGVGDDDLLARVDGSA